MQRQGWVRPARRCCGGRVRVETLDRVEKFRARHAGDRVVGTKRLAAQHVDRAICVEGIQEPSHFQEVRRVAWTALRGRCARRDERQLQGATHVARPSPRRREAPTRIVGTRVVRTESALVDAQRSFERSPRCSCAIEHLEHARTAIECRRHLWALGTVARRPDSQGAPVGVDGLAPPRVVRRCFGERAGQVMQRLAELRASALCADRQRLSQERRTFLRRAAPHEQRAECVRRIAEAALVGSRPLP